MIEFLIKKFLRRPFFKGQDRIFYVLFKRNILNKGTQIVYPLLGNFLIEGDTATWIGAKIVYTGDYEANLKKVFKMLINIGDNVLDIGANIGFHSLFFAELVGKNGKVQSFEPVPYNFVKLLRNIKINNATQIKPFNFALGNKNEQLLINADENSTNPGSFNLFNTGGNIAIDCFIGSEIINEEKVDFIKIDVEGYESFVIDGLLPKITKDMPKLIFEYDQNYHEKTGVQNNYILDTLAPLGYHFYLIQQFGFTKIDNLNDVKSSNILALPKNQNII